MDSIITFKDHVVQWLCTGLQLGKLLPVDGDEGSVVAVNSIEDAGFIVTEGRISLSEKITIVTRSYF